MDKKRDFSFSSYFYFHPETYVPLISCHLKCCSCSNGFNGNYLRVSFSLAIDTEMHKKSKTKEKLSSNLCSVIFLYDFFSLTRNSDHQSSLQWCKMCHILAICVKLLQPTEHRGKCIHKCLCDFLLAHIQKSNRNRFSIMFHFVRIKQWHRIQ